MQKLDLLIIFFNESYRFSGPSFSYPFLIRVWTTAPPSDGVYFSWWRWVALFSRLKLRWLFSWWRWSRPFSLLSTASDEPIEVASSDKLFDLLSKLIHFSVSWPWSRWYKQNLFGFLQVGKVRSFRASKICPLISISTFSLGVFNGVVLNFLDKDAWWPLQGLGRQSLRILFLLY